MEAAIASYRAFCKGCVEAVFTASGEWVCLKRGVSVLPYEQHGCWKNRWEVK